MAVFVPAALEDVIVVGPPSIRAVARDDDDDAPHAAAYRVLLRHAGFTPQRQLARAACVCVAWRDDSRADEHNVVLRFDVPGPHVARTLLRFAHVVEELHVEHLPPPGRALLALPAAARARARASQRALR
jgi:hypothetical protein